MHMRTATVLSAAATVVAAAMFVPIAPAHASTAATDGPGTTSHFDLARKDCLGTARNTTSKVWYTVAGGVLSDVYAPTIDTTNVETMQYVVTDGKTFTDLQTRDTTYTVASDETGMVCTVTATAKSKAYRLVTTYLTDPNRSAVVLHTDYQPLTSAAHGYQLYVRLDASAGGNGGGGKGNGGAVSRATHAAGALAAIPFAGHRPASRACRSLVRWTAGQGGGRTPASPQQSMCDGDEKFPAAAVHLVESTVLRHHGLDLVVWRSRRRR